MEHDLPSVLHHRRVLVSSLRSLITDMNISLHNSVFFFSLRATKTEEKN
jgi:hypothetical protein